MILPYFSSAPGLEVHLLRISLSRDSLETRRRSVPPNCRPCWDPLSPLGSVALRLLAWVIT
ncbi:hypothetical protein Chor_005325 [Crotalus horridus]